MRDAMPMKTAPRDGSLVFVRRHGAWVAAMWTGRGFQALVDRWWLNEADGWLPLPEPPRP